MVVVLLVKDGWPLKKNDSGDDDDDDVDIRACAFSGRLRITKKTRKRRQRCPARDT